MKLTTRIATTRTGKPAHLALSLLAAIGLAAGFASAASAQDVDVAQPQQIFNDQDSRNPFSNRGSDQAGGVMDLVHRAMQAGSSLSPEDFYNQQQENLDSAAADFRAAQQQRLGGKVKPAPSTPTAVSPTPPPTN